MGYCVTLIVNSWRGEKSGGPVVILLGGTTAYISAESQSAHPTILIAGSSAYSSRGRRLSKCGVEQNTCPPWEARQQALAVCPPNLFQFEWKVAD